MKRQIKCNIKSDVRTFKVVGSTGEWGDRWYPYSGAEWNTQTYRLPDGRSGYVHAWECDGDYGYDAYTVDNNEQESLIGSYDSRDEAKKAVEDALSAIDSSSDVRTFKNKRNENKYLETKKYKDGHTVSRQYMKWDMPEGEVKNYMGSKTNRGRWYRTGQQTLNNIVEDDYDEIDSATTITSGRWNYQLKHGSALRNAINSGDAEDVLDQLLKSYEELRDEGLIDEDDFERYTGDFEMYDVDDEDFEDDIDYELDDFYDLCDNIGVWITLD